MTMTYKDAGVNIDAGNALVKRITPKVKNTFSKDVLSGIGSFGALFDLKPVLADYDHPVLVQSIDGVGTKTQVAQMVNNYQHLGTDLLSATSNDILVLGAKTLTLLDYIANDALNPVIVDQIVTGLCDACIREKVSLVGGETAEMPDTYKAGEHDVVGVVTGVVEKSRIIDGKTIIPGDKVYGLPSSGLHTNGFSLARNVLFEIGKLKPEDFVNECQGTLAEALLAPHVNYAAPIHALLEHSVNIKGMAHITGGGLRENIPRILPAGMSAEIREGSWPVLPIFDIISYVGEVVKTEMYRTFNMGIGMVLVSSEDKATLENILHAGGFGPIYELGAIIPGDQTVELR